MMDEDLRIWPELDGGRALGGGLAASAGMVRAELSFKSAFR
jgi:hypothetical protein